MSQSAAAETARVISDRRATFASEATFRAFYERALPRVYGYLLGRCGDAATAEELTQQAFTEAIRWRSRFDGRSDPLTWVIGIARHKLADHFRRLEREERRHQRLGVHALEAASDSAVVSRVDERAQLLEALGRLPALQRAVLVLHYADGLPVREVARAVGKSESATESLLTRGRASMRRAYGEEDDDA